jgi:hypothetical protein
MSLRGLIVWAILFAGITSRTAQAAQGSQSDAQWDTFVLRSGALVAVFGSHMRIDSSNGLGTSIDLENDLGFATNETTFFIDGVWRISRRNQLQGDFVRTSRDVSDSIVTRPITIRGTTYTANASIDAFLDTPYISANYGFAFVATPTLEVGAIIGVTVIRFHSGFGLSAAIQGGASVSRDLHDNVQFIVPVPLPGVFVHAKLSDRVTARGSLRYLKISVNQFGGGETEGVAGADVKLIRWFGIGGSYYYNRLSADHSGSTFLGSIAYSFSGPQVYALFAF